MRLLTAFLSIPLLTALLLSPSGCTRKPEKPQAEATGEKAAALATMVSAADPRLSAQLLKGFYGIEQNAWRWTKGNFSVRLSAPAGASQKGARLILKCTVPPVVIQRLTAVKLAANIEGFQVPEETYSQPGNYVYSRDIPAKVFDKDAVTVNFALDKCMPPGNGDARELGLVVSMVGFEAN